MLMSTAKVPNLRPRSPSDPFLDTPTLSHSVASTASGTATLNSNNATTEADDRLTELPSNLNQQTKETFDPDEDNEGPFLRVWTVADLGNPELQALISLFPDFLARHALPRFPIQASKGYMPDVEAGLNPIEERGEVSCGTGRMWVGRKMRSYGWQGRWWQRFTAWWRQLLGC